MRTWRIIWGTLSLGALIGTLCGYNWMIIPAAFCALMYVACTVDQEEKAEEDRR